MISGPDVGRRQQALDGLVERQVLVDDGPDILRLYAGVHDAFGVDQHARAEVAGAEAAGVSQLEAGSPQVAGGEFVREGLPGRAAALFLAGTARMSVGATLDADEDMFLGF